MACHVALATGADACCCRRYACAACFSVASPHQSLVSAGAKIVISAVGGIADLPCAQDYGARAARNTEVLVRGTHTHSCTAASRRSGQCRERPAATNKNCVILCKTAHRDGDAEARGSRVRVRTSVRVSRPHPPCPPRRSAGRARGARCRRDSRVVTRVVKSSCLSPYSNV